MLDPGDARICVIGLGYVGLPLAVEFGKSFPTVGFDVNANRIRELCEGRDSTLEVTSSDLVAAKHLRYTQSSDDDLRDCNV
ncbi:MAG: Vi polysaccharide biosynthesis UDP-N-acetylglucosamine C-6 dehydrogenase TviB, partial [Gammaproteobacteria bacterium]|nr:Vi polysaccharide biosynthesis UDP-N-acetylglucosamine C-6 dehydrogenase TviB [Gammaproteobacteria bacterium]